MRVRQKVVGGVTTKRDVACREARGFERAGNELDRAERRCAVAGPGSGALGRKSLVRIAQSGRARLRAP